MSGLSLGYFVLIDFSVGFCGQNKLLHRQVLCF